MFHSTNLSIALVNLKPLLPGHVLVIPRRVTPRLSDLSHAELSDLFVTVQRVGRMVERVYEASSLNIALQDGPEAGQSVPHVHAHIIPRKRLDLEARGGADAIYGMLEGEEGDVGAHLTEEVAKANRANKRPKFPTIEESARNARSEEEMAEEARMLTEEMGKTI